LAVLGPRVVKSGPLGITRILLVVNWLPHSFFALAAASIYYPGGGID
jgi:hypothetical protein